MNLSHNKLSGLIPTAFVDLVSLTAINISFNELEGPIPKIKGFTEAPFEAFMNNSVYFYYLSWLGVYTFTTEQVEKEFPATNNFNSNNCIGKGGNGIVYPAMLPIGQVVAVKKLHSSREGELMDLKTFKNEIRMLMDIRHRNIVSL
ncbi:hypothetical protein NC651_029902 [Populus alba x Populus x berolinensis]|nr:hypothetical protein NC651_029902 [Populus alba x Populus x berolinensis]